MPRVAILPSFTLKEGQREAFITRVSQQRDDSLREEPGCLHFDVLDPADGEDVVLYEIYTDAAAMEAHRTTPHYAAFRADIDPMVENLTIRSFELTD